VIANAALVPPKPNEPLRVAADAATRDFLTHCAGG
jgi:hypothetical protein